MIGVKYDLPLQTGYINTQIKSENVSQASKQQAVSNTTMNINKLLKVIYILMIKNVFQNTMVLKVTYMNTIFMGSLSETEP